MSKASCKYKSGAKEAGAQAGSSQRGNSSRSLSETEGRWSEGVPPKASMSQFSDPKRGSVPNRYGGTVQRRHVHVVCASRFRFDLAIGTWALRILHADMHVIVCASSQINQFVHHMVWFAWLTIWILLLGMFLSISNRPYSTPPPRALDELLEIYKLWDQYGELLMGEGVDLQFLRVAVRHPQRVCIVHPPALDIYLPVRCIIECYIIDITREYHA